MGSKNQYGPRDLKRLRPNDRHWALLVDVLWRELSGLYFEKFLSVPADPDDPKQQFLKGSISDDIDFGYYLGQDHLLEGNRSAAFGQGAVTKSFMELLLGAYPTVAVDQNPEEWIPSDRLMALGNGLSDEQRSLVFEILKSGFFKFLSSIKIGAWVPCFEGDVPEDGTLQWTPENGLEEWDTDHWESLYHPPVTIAPDSQDLAEIGDDQILSIKKQGIEQVVSETVEPAITNIINNTIPEAIKTATGNNHESYLIENTANVSETVVSSWSVLPYNEQVGEFKAVVMVRNKALNTIITLMNILSFDYSDAVKVVQQNPMLTDANITLTVGVDAGTSKLYATVAGMTTDNKRIHLCFERCVLGERLISLPGAELDLVLETAAILTAYLNLEATAEIALNFEAGMSGYSNLQAEFTTMLEASAILSVIAGLQANVHMALNAQAILGAYKKLIANNFTLSLNTQAILSGYGFASLTGNLPLRMLSIARLSQSKPSAPNLYRSHGIMAEMSGLEPSVIVENGLIRLWYTFEDYISPIYMPGASNYGTMFYPFTNLRIMYKEMAVSEFEYNVQNGIDLVWQNEGVCMNNVVHSFVYKGPDNKYNLIGRNSIVNKVELWQSDSGSPGTWTKISADLGFFTTDYAIGNNSFFWDGSAWHLWQEYAKWGTYNNWRASYWTGPTLTSLTRVDSFAAPAINGPANCSTSAAHVLPNQYDGRWVNWSHDTSISNAVVPTDLALYTSYAKNTGWSRVGWLLRLQDLGYFKNDVNRPFNSDSQVADTFIFEINGKTYFMYETIWKQLYDIPALSVGWYNCTTAELISLLAPPPKLEASLSIKMEATAILYNPSTPQVYSFENAFDASSFVKFTAVTGTVTENAAGEKIYCGTTSGSLAGIRLINSFNIPAAGTTVTFKFRVKLDASVPTSQQASVFTIFQSSTEIVAAPVNDLISKRRILAGLNCASSSVERSPIYMVNSAGATNVIARANTYQPANTYFDYILEMTSSQVRVSIIRVSDSVSLANTGWKNLGTDIKNDGNPLWLLVGNVWTDSVSPINFYLQSITKITT